MRYARRVNRFTAEVRVGDTAIWLHRVTAEHGLTSALVADMPSSGLVVHVADVDGHFVRARAAGARIDSEPVDQPYGQREYGARDPEGHRWWFATLDSRHPCRRRTSVPPMDAEG